MIKNPTNSPKLPLELDAWKLQEDKHTAIVKLIFKPGEFIDIHKNPLKVIFYLLKGYGKIIVEDKEYYLQTGDLIEVEKNLDRGWFNEKLENLEILVCKQL